jgi:hypothetical protein
MPVPVYDQRNYNIGDPDNANIDLCSYDGNSTARTGQAKESNFIVRVQVAEDAGNNGLNVNWQLFYNKTGDDPVAGAVQITTTSADVISTSDTPNTNPATNVCTAQAETFINGLHRVGKIGSGQQRIY